MHRIIVVSLLVLAAGCRSSSVVDAGPAIATPTPAILTEIDAALAKRQQGNAPLATTLLLDAATHAKAAKDLAGEAWALHRAGDTLLDQDRCGPSLARYVEAMTLHQRLGDRAKVRSVGRARRPRRVRFASERLEQLRRVVGRERAHVVDASAGDDGPIAGGHENGRLRGALGELGEDVADELASNVVGDEHLGERVVAASASHGGESVLELGHGGDRAEVDGLRSRAPLRGERAREGGLPDPGRAGHDDDDALDLVGESVERFEIGGAEGEAGRAKHAPRR